ncbi:MAG: twin-arginine translocase TatA/TatE family subunit [Actinobacteria bacterium]|nr:twin-arginine translocase TatA/TatE family subunit [Actinomycetota bacterium]
MPSIGWQELLLVLVAAMLIFGPKLLPEIGRGLGKGIKEFKGGISDSSASEKDDELKN